MNDIPTLDQVKEKHTTALRLLDEFESTIPNLSTISQEYAPQIVTVLRSRCNIIVSNAFEEPSEATLKLETLLGEKTGIESIDSGIEKVIQESKLRFKKLDEKILQSADEALEKVTIEIKALKGRYL